MPANKTNYIVLYKNNSQVYGAGSKEIALTSPPPDGYNIEDKMVFFITLEPDTDDLCIYKLPDEEVLNSELKYPKKKNTKESQEEDE